MKPKVPDRECLCNFPVPRVRHILFERRGCKVTLVPSPRLFREVVVTKLSAVMAAVFCCLAVIDKKVTFFEKELVHLPDLPFFIGLVSRFLKPKRQQTWWSFLNAGFWIKHQLKSRWFKYLYSGLRSEGIKHVCELYYPTGRRVLLLQFRSHLQRIQVWKLSLMDYLTTSSYNF